MNRLVKTEEEMDRNGKESRKEMEGKQLHCVVTIKICSKKKERKEHRESFALLYRVIEDFFCFLFFKKPLNVKEALKVTFFII